MPCKSRHVHFLGMGRPGTVPKVRSWQADTAPVLKESKMRAEREGQRQKDMARSLLAKQAYHVVLIACLPCLEGR